MVLRQSLANVFGRDVFVAGTTAPGQFPVLAGASMLVGFDHGGKLFLRSDAAWHGALNWLRDFRQTQGVGRNKGQGTRPGRSRWPEPDKLRHLSGCVRVHKPDFNDRPAWPRAGFGLPIIGKFTGGGEPPPFELNWENDKGEVKERMASPLIVKPLPVKGGFLACALWLNRAYPPGDVVLVNKDGNKRIAVARSAAPFDRLIGTGDVPNKWLEDVISGQDSLRDAFLNWACKERNLWRVA